MANHVKKTAILETGDRILRMLECFTAEKPEWGVTELGEHLGLYKSVVHRMLVTLEHRGFVIQNPVTQKYTLGIKLFELGTIVANRMSLRTVAKPIMEKLCESTGETVMLMIIDGLEGICIEKVESSQSVRYTSPLGKRVSLHAGATTKILMANLPPDKINQIISGGLQKYTEYTIVDPSELLDHLQTIREQGYCISSNDFSLGGMGIAVPIRDHTGEVIAGLSISGLEFRMSKITDELLQQCQNAAKLISQRLGAL
ncbi:IclR family transcriptional regulator [Paenibacillus doosanensis]|uniref:HTH-type transcriptional regulator KipR n=1 Tax=Paenibacillus konkukensis TaxID=2020716 RepID=A0ABY4RM13_9BACL|nr:MULTISPECIES: IclR family transcriptional regulator [Paenibacillus]MCS7462132.1 IclR family transcriptional regulator [Paenibacillus doosanensis]UQZ83484.1 HTH-type transcriptional regulator KipR [Paenibacillus konkukensis]